MSAEAATTPAQIPVATTSTAARWGKRIGGIAFLFFLIKGLAWLLVPAAIVAWAAR